MYCTYCGKQLDENSKFCCYCGKEVNEVEKTKESVKGKIFAYIGFGTGIESLIMSLIPFVCFYTYLSCIPGIIFSKKGMNSSKANYANKGRILNKLAFIFAPIMSVITILVIYIIASY